jgi:ABC-2 type transport system ATP-binding protein
VSEEQPVVASRTSEGADPGALAIETRRLRKDFGRKTAVRDLTLAVPRGAVVGFLGPNGAGKTTSMKMLLGLVKPTAGRGRLLGAPLGDVAARAHIGFLPEHFRFHEWLTGRELLKLHGQLLGLGGPKLAAQVEALLARVQLDKAAAQRVREYSKGMQQRLGLAQALLNDPQLVFLDEPTSGLDPLGRLLVRGIIEELKGHGTTVFLNSHLLSEVERTCDQVLFIRDGRIIRDMHLGGSEQRLEVELRLDRVTPAILEGLQLFAADVRQVDDGLRLVVDSEARLPEMTRWLAGEGVGLYHLAVSQRSLETLFLEVMRGDGGVSGSEAA